MSQELETGTVIWFNTEKNYGFAEDRWGQRIFFHLSNGRDCMIKNGELVFFKPRSFADNKVTTLTPPTIGSVIQFVRAKGSLGRSKAKPWTYEHMVEDAYKEDFYDNLVCSCGHKELEHSGGECQHPNCHCGDRAYDDDQQDDTGGCGQEEPGSITDCW